MNTIRKGQIVDLDLNKKLGIIIDENGQDIPFELNDQFKDMPINSDVLFKIRLSQQGLRAVEIDRP